MSRLVYGIDLDGICFNFLKAFCEWLEEHAGIPIPDNEEITSYYWYETVDGLDKDTFWNEFHRFGHSGGYRNLELLPGALEGLHSIVNAGHRIFYVTNRPEYARKDTEEALSEHRFPFAANLEFAKGAKAPVVRDLGICAFIDDSPRTIAELCANTSARIYCMDYPMNREIHDIHNFTRVKSWDEFLRAEGIHVEAGRL